MAEVFNVVGSSRGEIELADGQDAHISMVAKTQEGTTIEIHWSYDRAREFEEYLASMIMSAAQQIASRAREPRPTFVIPLPLADVAVEPDLLLQKVGIAVDTGTTYRTVWALDLEKVPQLIASLEAAVAKANQRGLGRA